MFAHPLALLTLAHAGVTPHVHPHEAPAAIALVLALLVGTLVVLRRRWAQGG